MSAYRERIPDSELIRQGREQAIDEFKDALLKQYKTLKPLTHFDIENIAKQIKEGKND